MIVYLKKIELDSCLTLILCNGKVLYQIGVTDVGSKTVSMLVD